MIDTVPVIDGPEDFVFSLNGDASIKGWSKFKAQLDAGMLAALREQAKEAGEDRSSVTLKPWQHRDLRRTARTLMARAGVHRDISERCLAHVLGGIEAVYNRYDYLREKQTAFVQLAALIEHIVNPAIDSNVIPLAQRAKQPKSK